MTRLVAIGLLLFFVSCNSRSNEQIITEQLNGEWLSFDTLEYTDDTFYTKELIQFNSDSFVFKTYVDSKIEISKGKFFITDNKLRKNHILVLVPDSILEVDGDLIIDSPLYYEILKLTDRNLVVRGTSGDQRFFVGGKLKLHHDIQIFNLKSKLTL